MDKVQRDVQHHKSLWLLYMAYTIWGGQETPRRSCGEGNILMAAKTSEGETGGVALGSATLH